MSLPTATQRRLPTIKAKLIQGWTIGQIADICKVHEKTIDRDLKAFLDSGEFEVWLKEEWTRLHSKIIKSNPVEAYKQVTKLISRNITRKAEIKTTHQEEIRERLEVTLNINKLSAKQRKMLMEAEELLTHAENAVR